MIRFTIPLPTRQTAAKIANGRSRSEARLSTFIDNETKRLWRATLMCIKAKLESVESHIETFEEAFLSHIVTDDKRTIYERIFVDKKTPFKMLAPMEADK